MTSSTIMVASFRSFVYSFFGILFGLLLSIAIFLISMRKRSVSLGEIIAVGLKSVPAFIFPILLGNLIAPGGFMKVLVSGLICFFPILVGLQEGINRVPISLKRTADVYAAKRIREFFNLEYPWVISGALEGIKSASPLAVVGAIVAEYVNASDTENFGLGVLFSSNKHHIPSILLLSAFATLLGCIIYASIYFIKMYFDKRYRIV